MAFVIATVFVKIVTLYLISISCVGPPVPYGSGGDQQSQYPTYPAPQQYPTAPYPSAPQPGMGGVIPPYPQQGMGGGAPYRTGQPQQGTAPPYP